MSDHEPGTTTREVRVDDPNLSPETNRALTDDLQKAVGAKEVRVDEDAPDHRRDVRGAAPAQFATPTEARNRLLLAVTFVAAVVVGAILALVADNWWLLLVPIGVHALGSLLVAAVVLQMSTQTEQPDPRTTRALEDEGVSAPEMAFNNLVEELDDREERAHGATEVIGTAQHEQGGADDPSGQQSAMTPSDTPTRPAGDRSVMMVLMEWMPIVGLILFSLILAIANGGRWWVLPAVVVPLCALWIVFVQMTMRGESHKRVGDAVGPRSEGDTGAAAGRTAILTAASVAAIVGVTAIVILLVV